ncbi:hypothetical protein L6164_006222 [Bauhinia variegata]|uniref:Uncharacterized protein n=1 Tax=Bauhinia variegata TaxID=167791 RepID=A0ACB9PTQ9_BAUVA|nr:hypothetical protein L6164_006222 [Bauhinia variegata]
MDSKKKMIVRYKECLKNHAAAIGGNATDGCGEFMPAGGEHEGSNPEALICSACNCHRNFHRKEEIESDDSYDHFPNVDEAAKPILDHLSPKKSGSNVSDQFDEKGYDEMKVAEKERKRFRTKFTQEQKEKMLRFAENAGWRIQKLDESLVQQFCQEVGIKRRVLKVWMHNNKNTFAKRNLISSAPLAS